jgi:hypothetical protein
MPRLYEAGDRFEGVDCPGQQCGRLGCILAAQRETRGIGFGCSGERIVMRRFGAGYRLRVSGRGFCRTSCRSVEVAQVVVARGENGRVAQSAGEVARPLQQRLGDGSAARHERQIAERSAARRHQRLVLALFGLGEGGLKIAAGVAEITLDPVRLAASRQRLSLEIGGGVEPAQTDRLRPIAGGRDDIPGTKGRRSPPEVIEGRGAAALDLRGRRSNVQQ